MNLFDRQIINVLAQSIKADLKITDTQLGFLTGTAFAFLYATLGIPLGRLADRTNRIKMIAAAMLIWSAFTSLCGLSASYWQLLGARIGVSVGEAGSQPASTSIIADLYPEGRRATAMSLYLLSIPVGSFAGLFIGGSIGAHLGWRAAFVLAGLPGFFLLLVMFLTMRDPPKVGHDPASESDHGMVGTVLALFARAGFPWLVLAMICCAFQVYVAGAWLPPFFIRVYGMTTGQIGWFAALAVGVGGAIGTLGSGWICDRLVRRRPGAEWRMLVGSLGLTAPAMLLVVLPMDRNLALIGMFTFNVFAFSYLGPGVTLIQRAATVSTRAIAIAVTTTIASVISLGGGLPFVGFLSDWFSAEMGARGLGFALLSCSVAGIVGSFASWRVGHALARARTSEAA